MRDIDINQHCTASDPSDYTFSHTARYCGRPQPHRCNCGFDYPAAWAEYDAASYRAESADTDSLRAALTNALTDHDNPEVPNDIRFALLLVSTNHDDTYLDTDDLAESAAVTDTDLRAIILNLIETYPDDRLIDAVLQAL